MAAIQIDPPAIEMIRQMPIDASNPNVLPLADAMSKIMPIITRIAEISNLHSAALGAHDNGSMRALEGNMQASNTNLVQAMKTTKSMLQQQQSQDGPYRTRNDVRACLLKRLRARHAYPTSKR